VKISGHVHLAVTTAKPDRPHLNAVLLVDMPNLGEINLKVPTSATCATPGIIVLMATKRNRQEIAHQDIIVKLDLQSVSRRMILLVGSALQDIVVQKVVLGPSRVLLGNITTKLGGRYVWIVLPDLSVLSIRQLLTRAQLDIIAR
jgi:hypothetical protein